MIYFDWLCEKIYCFHKGKKLDTKVFTERKFKVENFVIFIDQMN